MVARTISRAQEVESKFPGAFFIELEPAARTRLAPLVSERVYRRNQVVFAEGDLAESFFLVVEGGVEVVGHRPDGRRVLLARETKGRVFGEKPFMPGATEPRRVASARALVRTRLLVYPPAVLEALLAADHALAHRVVERPAAVCERKPARPSRRAVQSDGLAVQFGGPPQDEGTATTVLRLEDGEALVSTRSRHQAGHATKVVRAAGASTLGRVVQHKRPDGQLAFEARFDADNTLSDYSAFVDGPEAQGLFRLARSGRSLRARDLDQLTETGSIDLPSLIEDRHFLCSCLQVPEDEVRAVIASGCRTFEAVQSATGCGTVCGGCHFRTVELIDAGAWIPVDLKEVLQVSPGLRTLRLLPKAGVLPRHAAGQRLDVRAEEGRGSGHGTFPLVSPSIGSDYLEVAVSTAGGDAFTRWLFERAVGDTGLQVSVVGGGGSSLDAGRATLFFVSGAAVSAAPALAFVRTRVERGDSTPCLVHYTVTGRGHAPWLSELEAIATQHHWLTVWVHNAAARGPLGQDELQALLEPWREARVVVSGPPRYLDHLHRGLEMAGLAAADIDLQLWPGEVNDESTPKPQAPGAGAVTVGVDWLAYLRPMLPLSAIALLPVMGVGLGWSAAMLGTWLLMVSATIGLEVFWCYREWHLHFGPEISESIWIHRDERRPPGFSTDDSDEPAPIRGVVMHPLPMSAWLRFKFTLRLDYLANNLVRSLRHHARKRLLAWGYEPARSWSEAYQPHWDRIERQLGELVLETSLSIGVVRIARNPATGRREGTFQFNDWLCVAGPAFEGHRFDVDCFQVVVDLEERVAVSASLDGDDLGVGRDALSIAFLALVIYHHPIVHAFANWSSRFSHHDRLLERAAMYTVSLNAEATMVGMAIQKKDDGSFRHVLNRNARKGIYRHGTGPLMASLKEYSRFCRFALDGRKAVLDVLKEHEVDIDAEAFFLMSLLHSVDHFQAARCVDPRDLVSQRLGKGTNYRGAEVIRVLFTEQLNPIFVNPRLKAQPDAWAQDLWRRLDAIDGELAARVDYCIAY